MIDAPGGESLTALYNQRRGLLCAFDFDSWPLS